jgi:hypothetical protein
MAKRNDGVKRTNRDATKGSTEPAAATTPLAETGAPAGRSGGLVDAPGKTHRRQMPPDPDANIAHSQAAKIRTATRMVKTHRRRGRA